MRDLHIHPDLLGQVITDARGSKRRLMAVWLEDQGSPQIPRTCLAGLIVGLDGECFKVYLPDTGSWFKVKEDG